MIEKIYQKKFFIDKLPEIVKRYNNTTYTSIKWKFDNIKLDIYVDFLFNPP